jgi:hypothetical protein
MYVYVARVPECRGSDGILAGTSEECEEDPRLELRLLQNHTKNCCFIRRSS